MPRLIPISPEDREGGNPWGGAEGLRGLLSSD
jgi:hypothetical protein